MSMPKFHGIELAQNGYIKNTRVEIIQGDPIGTLLPGRIWYNDIENEWKYTYINDSTGLIETGAFSSFDQSGASSDSGWKDNIMPMSASLVPVNEAPAFAYLDNGIGYYHFPDNKNKHLMCYFHINHDYKPDSLIYPHIHWGGMSSSIGDVHWRMEYNIVKGHSQGGLFNDPITTIDLIQSGSGIISEHIVTECSDLQAFTVLEPDTVVSIKLYRMGAEPTDTFIGETIGVFVDLHYQTDRDSTPNKMPNFYT